MPAQCHPDGHARAAAGARVAHPITPMVPQQRAGPVGQTAAGGQQAVGVDRPASRRCVHMRRYAAPPFARVSGRVSRGRRPLAAARRTVFTGGVLNVSKRAHERT
jgi:hypothetical protein